MHAKRFSGGTAFLAYRFTFYLFIRFYCALVWRRNAAPLVSRLSHIFMDTINFALFICYVSSLVDGWEYESFFS